MNELAESWRRRGRYHTVDSFALFVVELPPTQVALGPPVVFLHGFPTSSFDFASVVDELARHRRLFLPDLLGFGLSDKPDLPYSLGLQADLVSRLLADLAVTRCALVSHDIGNLVGAELLARHLEGSWPVEVTARVLTNGLVYADLARPSNSRQFLLRQPDRRIDEQDAPDRAAVLGTLTATYSPTSAPDPDVLAAQWDLISFLDGHRLIHRTARHVAGSSAAEARLAGALAHHPSPLTVVWGSDDPLALPDDVRVLASRLGAAGFDLLPGAGRYLMLEAPRRFAEAVSRALG
ncbi:MAG: alpha/beta fold hydrolase [Acidimicrobiales bacterium]